MIEDDMKQKKEKELEVKKNKDLEEKLRQEQALLDWQEKESLELIQRLNIEEEG